MPVSPSQSLWLASLKSPLAKCLTFLICANAILSAYFLTILATSLFGLAFNEPEEPTDDQILNVETGEVFVSYSEAAKKYKISVTPISNCCKGKQQTAGGYHWKYFDEDKE